MVFSVWATSRISVIAAERTGLLAMHALRRVSEAASDGQVECRIARDIAGETVRGEIGSENQHGARAFQLRQQSVAQ